MEMGKKGRREKKKLKMKAKREEGYLHNKR